MVRKPTPEEEYITIIDNKSRERVQHVVAFIRKNKTMTIRRQLKILFQEPGLLEAIATNSAESHDVHKPSQGYRDSSIPDLMLDYRVGSDRPFAWMSYNFHKSYPSVIWGLKLLMADELFDVPQAGLVAVPLHDAFSWAYAHFVLEDELPNLTENGGAPTNLTRQVLHYAAAVA